MSGLTSAATRLMASLLSLWRRQRGHEPSGIIGPRLWSQTQPQRVRAFQSAAAGASRTAALRFLESLHGIRFAHGDFELSTLERSLQAGADGGESIQLPEGCVPRGRFMERNRARRHRAGQAAFTMVEIALCLGVIAIALVAIIGVLPTGVRVQRDNREDTIINQEGLFLLEAIRSGSRGLDYLTNYFDTITTSNVLGVTVYTTPQLQRTVPAGAVFGGLITNGQQIVSLLTRPKYDLNGKFTNHVAARVRAITGSALEKSVSARDMAFAYQVIPEVVPLNVHPPDSTNYLAAAARGFPPAEILTRSNLWRLARNEAVNFFELRLTLQGPLIPKGNTYDVLGTPRTFRTLVSGAIVLGPGNTSYVLPSTFLQQ